MKHNVAGYIPKLLFKFYLKLKERFDPTIPIPEEEIFCVEICKKLIANPESKLTLAPISMKRFIKYEPDDMFIVLHSHTINLINHVYSYNVYVQDTDNYNELIKMFDQTLEERRQLLEDEIRGNIQKSFKTILNRLDN